MASIKFSVAIPDVKTVVSNSVTFDQPTFNVGFFTTSAGTTAATAVNEGTATYGVVKTTNIPNGTILTYALSGSGINTNDTTIALTGNITINDNIGFITVTPKADATTEGNETITLTVKHGSNTVGTDTITVTDTSKTPPTYSVGFYTSNTGTTEMTSVNEGATTWLVVKINNYDGSTVSYTLSGTGITIDDTTAALTGTLTVNSGNIAAGTITPKLDTATEGNETLTATIRVNGVVVGTTSIVVNDTSVVQDRVTIVTPDPTYRGYPKPYIMEEYWSGSNFDNRDDTYYILVGDYATKTYRESDPDVGSWETIDNIMTELNLPDRSFPPTYNIPHNFNTADNIAKFGFSLSFVAVTYGVSDWWSGNTGYKEYDGLAWIHTKNDAGRHTKLYLKFKGTTVLTLTRSTHTLNGDTWYTSEPIPHNTAANWVEVARQQMVNDNGSYEFTISYNPL